MNEKKNEGEGPLNVPSAHVELRAEMEEHKGHLPPLRPKGKKGIVIGVIVVVVLLLGLGAWAAMSKNDSGDVKDEDEGLFGSLPSAEEIFKPAPRTTSAYSGLPCEYGNRRAIGVMLAADPINRPVSGFADADMVWELPALVSNVTRLLAVYQCGQPEDIGSVRSARHDYLFIAEGLDAIVGHWGGSYHALNRIDAGEFDTINALQNPFSAYFRKDHLPRPYNGFTTYEGLWNALQKLEYRQDTEFNGYEFKDDAPVGERGAAGTLSVNWPGQFRVSYEYNPETNRYERYWAGVRQVDGGTNAPVDPSVVVIMRATNELAVGDGGYNEVGIEGEGVAEIYQDGQVIKGTWKKNELEKTDPVHFMDESGKEVVFTRGQVWVMTPSDDIPVTWDLSTTSGAGQGPEV